MKQIDILDTIALMIVDNYFAHNESIFTMCRTFGENDEYKVKCRVSINRFTDDECEEGEFLIDPFVEWVKVYHNGKIIPVDKVELETVIMLSY